MPWKRPLPGRETYRQSYLQFGHGCDAVETSQRATCTATGSTSALQFGLGCDAVETHHPNRKTTRGLPILQFGHGCDAVETA